MVGTRVYFGGLPRGVREKDMERFLKGYGPIREISLKDGYAFVDFSDYKEANDVVYELNGKDFWGARVRVELARGVKGYRGSHYRGHRVGDSRHYYRPPTRTDFRLIVENLSNRVSWQDLKDYVREAGEVTYAKKERSVGMVEFASYSEMKSALEKLDDTELDGRRIRLIEDRRGGRSGERRRRSSSSSASNSRGRSRARRGRDSRSRSRSQSRSRSTSASRGDIGEKSKSGKVHHHRKGKSVSRSRSRSKPR